MTEWKDKVQSGAIHTSWSKSVRTGVCRARDIRKSWILIDARNAIVGRLASEVAKILKGKHKPSYTPYLDCGDNVIIVNADKVRLSGAKADSRFGKVYYRHTGYPGGIKETTAARILSSPHPERVLRLAVLRMLKKTPQRNFLMRHLRLYAGEQHPHSAQSPLIYDFAAKNPKNTARSVR